MKYDYLNIIGLMTGTSIDGIDISLVKSNGINIQRSNQNYYYRYKDKTKKFLLNVLNQDIDFNLKNKKLLDKIVTEEHFKALKDFGLIEQSNLIGFHGQTIYHNPYIKKSIQLGDPLKLAKLCKKDVIFGFRDNDIENGGQGAPLAPIYHKLIMEDLKLDLPSCVLNIGGVANLTYWDGNDLIGFDTGPGNALMDNYQKKINGEFFDKNGVLASQGKPNYEIIEKFIEHKFFKKNPPKSLDRNSFLIFYNDIIKNNLSIADTMSTLAHITVECINLSIKILPKKIKNLIVTGGGYRNIYLMKCLKNKLNINLINENKLNIDFDYIESELIAFLSAKSIYNLPFTFPTTTGVLCPLSGGKLYSHL